MIAPEFPTHLEWLNTDRRHSIKDFKGKFVLLDFWTYCCINCMHVIPELKRLEEKYPELVVIGVHSAKFHNEKIIDNIAQAVLRYDIEHPIIIDNNFEIWKTYDIDAWPSFILIGPDRQIIGRASGEGIFERLDAVMGKLISVYQEAGKLNRERMQFALLKRAAPETFLRFPGKIDVDWQSRQIFISDSNHNRIVILNPEGEVLEVIGSGVQGRGDGSFTEAEFFRPQGIAVDSQRNCVYVADTENHLIRKADLKARTVTTVLGSGEKGGTNPATKLATKSAVQETQETSLETSLNSPWDLTISGGYLYIAMAGFHQIWRMDLESLRAEVYAGSGAEGISDGSRQKASLAQPSGITADGADIYFADSEVSAIRMIRDDVVTTLIGKGLFIFGDQDGLFPEARLQHPIGLHYHENALYIADSYNHKVKKADLSTREVTTIVGTGTAGRMDGNALEAGLNEPNDMAFLDGRLHIADTNNHAIRVYDPENGSVSTLAINPAAKESVAKSAAKATMLTERSMSSRSKGISFQLIIPEGYQWNKEAEQEITVTSENPDIVIVSSPTAKGEDFSYFIPLEIKAQGRTRLKLSLTGYYCNREALCCFQPVDLVLPLRIEDSSLLEDITVTYQLIP